MSERVLFFSPVGFWALHSVYEIAIANQIQFKGADYKFIMCDKQFFDCDVFLNCRSCKKIGRRTFESYGIPFSWMSEFISSSERSQAHDWAFSLFRDELPKACFRELPLGSLVRSSLHTRLHARYLNLEEPDIEKTYRDFLASAAVSEVALKRVFEDFKPTSLVLMNGRFFSHQVAMEFAKQSKIPSITHELGFVSGSLWLTEDETIHSLYESSKLWEEVSNTPLNLEALLYIHSILLDRRYGRRMPTKPFSSIPDQKAKVKKQLGLDDRPLILFATSTEQEFVASKGWEDVFKDQYEVLERTILFFKKKIDYQFVIRMHPFDADGRHSTKELPWKLKELMNKESPENVKVVWSNEKISTYTLMDLSDRAITYGSMTGLEMACLGKPVLVASHCPYYKTDFVYSIGNPNIYEAVLEKFLRTNSELKNVKRAYRYTYHYFTQKSVPIPTVSLVGPGHSFLDISKLNKKEKEDDLGLAMAGELVTHGKRIDLKTLHGEYASPTPDVEDQFFRDLGWEPTRGKAFQWTPKPLRILFLDKSSSSFQKWFYEIHDADSSMLSYETQVRSRNMMDVSLADAFAKNSLILGHEAHSIDVNNSTLQNQWAQQTGLTTGNSILHMVKGTWLYDILVEIVKSSSWMTRITRQALSAFGKAHYAEERNILGSQIRHLRPDVIIDASEGGVDPSFLTNFKPRYVKVLAVLTQGSSLKTDLRKYDMIFCSRRALANQLKEQGHSSKWLPPAFEHQMLNKLHIEKASDCRVIEVLPPGSQAGAMGLSPWCDPRASFRHYTEEPISFENKDDLIREFQRMANSGISVVLKGEKSQEWTGLEEMIFAGGVGSLLITDRTNELAELLDVEEEFVPVNSAQECSEKLSHYLSNEDERLKIAGACQEKILKDHTYLKRAKELVETLREFL